MTTDTLTINFRMRLFEQQGEFAACHAAEDWCKAEGFSVGGMQRGSPRGLLWGDFNIAKWRSLNTAEREALDGTMTGDMRNGPVVVKLTRAKATS